MVDFDALHNCRFLQPRNDQALGIGSRVTLRRTDDCGSGSVLPLYLRDAGLQVTLGASKGNLEQVGVQQRQQHLRLRVAEAAVVLQQQRPFLGQHEAAVQAPDVRPALRGHGVDSFLQDLFHFTPELRRQARRRSVGAHAPGVRALVVVVDPLVVLCGQHHRGHLAIGEGHAADLLADQQLLNDDLVAGGAEGLVDHDLAHRGLRLLRVGGHEHALARGDAAGLHNDLAAGGVLGLDVAQGGVVVAVLEGLVGGCGQPVLREEVLGKGLRSLELCCKFRRAETRDASSVARISEP
mmetsp:Transcript_173758/g.556896  ORF Transcript_173758/g.556896 Transcript_173758/m.556896 type:complete len:295 (-) Transcript_173758:283-1167(-)